MEIQFHGHQTEITDSLRTRATDGAHKLAEHLGRPVDADIWFDEDGVNKTVELVLHAPHYRKLVAKSEGKYHEPALTDAIAKLDAQIRRLKAAKKKQVHEAEQRVTRHPTVGELVERLSEPLRLDDLGAGVGLDRPLPGPDISSPGLALSGYVGRFVSDRLQVLGETEVSYVNSLEPVRRTEIIDLFFSFRLPAVFITKGQEPPVGLREAARDTQTALIRTALSTADFYRGVKPALEELFAPTTTLHGSLADVYGVGLFFTGASGIGKSECVLDLVERGHRLVADDMVLVSRRGHDVLIGRAHEMAMHHMEIRGVGLINIPSIFGIRSVRQQKRMEVVVHLETWDRNAPVERTGLDTSTASILGVEIPKITVPLNPGKNITVIAEVIAMNHLLHYSGINPAEQFNERLIQRMQKASAIRRYLQEDVE